MALTKRIVGGTEAPAHAYPFAVYLSIETHPSWHAVCGGTLVSSRHIITAAHCLFHAPSPQAVKLGIGNSQVKRQIKRQAKSYVLHPQFNMTTLVNDIAVVELANPVEMNHEHHRIPVYFGNVGEGQRIITMGWGVTSNAVNAHTVPTMNHVELTVAPSSKCHRVDPAFFSSNGPFICTSTLPGSRDECNGDSGSPAIIDVSTAPSQKRRLSKSGLWKWTQHHRKDRVSQQVPDMRLVALTSYGDNLNHDQHPPCGDPEGFGFSTHIAYYQGFITNATGLSRTQLEEPVQLANRQAIRISSAGPGAPQPAFTLWLSVLVATLVILRSYS